MKSTSSESSAGATVINTQPKLNRVVLQLVQGLATCIRSGTLIIRFPNEAREIIEGDLSKTPIAEIKIANFRALRRLLAQGDLGFAEAYMNRDWHTPDLPALLHLGALNERRFENAIGKWSLVKFFNRLQHLLNTNSRRQARKNISYHYDLGNDFYRKWLDDTMTYSAGIFANGFDDSQTSLRAAQDNKYNRLASALEIDSSHQILEIGCGWGGFMEHVLQNYHAHITGVSISKEQIEFAAKRIGGLDSAAKGKVIFRDYRDIKGNYDRIASIEMFEAVGEKYWKSYAEKLKQLLANDGRAALQVITISEQRFESYKSSADFIQRYIFPGGMLPSKTALKTVMENAGLRITDSFSFGPHYAETLRRWRVNFDKAWPMIESQGFNEKFRRMWHYYLAYCEVGFDTGATDVVQITLEHA